MELDLKCQKESNAQPVAQRRSMRPGSMIVLEREFPTDVQIVFILGASPGEPQEIWSQLVEGTGCF